MKAKIIHTLKLSLSVILLGGIIFHLSQQGDALARLKELSPLWSALLFGAHFLNYLLLGKAQAIGLSTLGVTLRLREWLGLSVVAELFNYVLPAKGGTAIRYLYLQTEHKVRLTDFLIMLSTYTFIALSVLGAVGLTYNLMAIRSDEKLFLIVNGLLFLLLASAPVFIFAFDLLKRMLRFEATLTPRHFVNQRRELLQCLAFYTLIFLLYPFKTAFGFYAVGITIPLPQMLEISLILLVVSLFPVLPGNIGVKELATAYLARRYGIDFEAALVASLVDRMILSLFVIPVGLLSYADLYLLRGKKSSPQA